MEEEIDVDGATIYRDTWGVPHIFAGSEESAIFAQGYAQAADRLPTIYKAYRKANGRMSEFFGPQWIEHDYRQHLLGHFDLARDRYGQLDHTVRRMVESFLSGIETFARENPQSVPEWSCELEPHGFLTLGWFIIIRWQLGEVLSKLKKAEVPVGASNEWVIGPNRSKEGCPIACIDPHVHWEDEWLFHESHLHGGRLHVFGFSPVGTPYVSLGHNRNLSWAMTTGGPNTSDVYEEKLSAEGERYLYDGEWRDIESRTIAIRVNGKDGYREVEREVRRTHHGPIVGVKDGKAYAIKLSLQDQIRLLEQIRLMNLAQNLSDFMDAMSMLQLMPQNTMYADTDGNLYYQRTGRVPIRPEGYDWKGPVPGDTSETEWMGIHPMEDLVQIKDPSAGFMQNCNISPGTMTFDSPLTEERYPDYIYNTSTGSTNARGSRFVEIMRTLENVGFEDAMGIMTDVRIHGIEDQLKLLDDAYERLGDEFPDLREAVEILRDWNGEASTDSQGMTLYWHWRRNLEQSLKGSRPDIDRHRATLAALRECCRFMKERFDSLEVPWGKINRGRRGDTSWPLAGCQKTLRAIGTVGPDESGIRYANRGQSCPTLVLLKRPITSYSAVPYGQSEDPESPHFTDQGERLFQNRRLKPTWFSKDKLMDHIESEEKVKMTGRR